MKIATLDRAALKNLRDPIEAELKALGERLGIAFSIGNGKYGEGAEATFQLVLKVDDPATKAAAAKAEWDRNCRYIGIDYANPENSGLRPEDLGTEFRYATYIARTVGIALKGKGSQKFPIKCEIVSDSAGRAQPGEIRLLPETAVAKIRAATDAAKGKEAIAA